MAIELFRRLAGELLGKNSVPPFHWRGVKALDRGRLGGGSLALDHRGRGLVLWENDGELWSQTIGPGTSPALVRLPQGEGRAVLMAVNLEGRGLASWCAPAGNGTQILGLGLGAEESPPRVIFTTAGKVHGLQAAVDRRGNALVVWLHEWEGTFEILCQSFDTRAHSWEAQPARLGLTSSQFLEPRLAVNQQEHAMVLWHTQNEDFDGLVACHYLPSQKAWSECPVAVVARRTAMHRVAMDQGGNAQALWVHSAHGERCGLEASWFDARTGVWGEPRTLARAEAFMSPQLAMSSSGEAFAAWCQAESSGVPRLFGKAFEHGSWEGEVERMDPGCGVVRDFALAIGSHGLAGLLTLQQGQEGYQAMGRWRDGTWSAPERLGGLSPAPLSTPRLALCPLGAVALWNQDGVQDRVLFATVAERTPGRS